MIYELLFQTIIHSFSAAAERRLHQNPGRTVQVHEVDTFQILSQSYGGNDAYIPRTGLYRIFL